MIGVIVAFSGLGFFYANNSQQSFDYNQEAEHQEVLLSDRLLKMAPQFGILFFIEFIAFFFLRQYRSAMDEFRYYEAIKRRRQELLVLFKIMKSDSSLTMNDLLKDNHFYSDAGKLSKGETTEVIETRKLEKDEIEVFQKIIDVVGKQAK